MKTVINLVLAACVVALVYICYGSIMGPINFDEAKKEREKAIIARLIDIRKAQQEYASLVAGKGFLHLITYLGSFTFEIACTYPYMRNHALNYIPLLKMRQARTSAGKLIAALTCLCIVHPCAKFFVRFA